MRAMIMLALVIAAGSARAETAEADAAAAPAAAEAPAAEGAAATGFGSSTRSWVGLQASGRAASAEARPLPGDAAKNVYERYTNSFKQPIPDKFDRESFASGSGSK